MRDAPVQTLTDEQLLDELAYLYSTRHQVLRRGSNSDLAAHTKRISELERDYLRRKPYRETEHPDEPVDPQTRT